MRGKIIRGLCLLQTLLAMCESLNIKQDTEIAYTVNIRYPIDGLPAGVSSNLTTIHH